jgi:hypothetical protein
VLALPDPSQARVWLTVERHNLLACVRAMSPTADAAELSTLPATHLHDFGFWSDARDLYRQALTACRHLGNQAAKSTGSGAWARSSGSSASTARLGSTTPRPCCWPGISVTGVVKPRRYGVWVR